MRFGLLIAILLFSASLSVYPIAFFHGIGNYCEDDADLLNRLSKDLNTHVECIEIGNGFITSIFRGFKRQAREACELIKANPHFQSKFSVFGVSQGVLLARYIIQACDMKGQVMRYLSFEGPQMGIGKLPKIECPFVCDWINDVTYKMAYTTFFQNNLAPASYYKYHYDYQFYLKQDTLIKDLNNEGEEKNEEYKRRFSSLEKVLFIKGKQDTVITPVESSWFEFYDLETGEKIVPLKESQFYIDDYIGLRSLMKQNKVSFAEFEGKHIIYNEDEYNAYFVPFFK